MIRVTGVDNVLGIFLSKLTAHIAGVLTHKTAYRQEGVGLRKR